MLPFVADEHFNNNIVRGIRRCNPAIDIVRVQDIGLSTADDPSILEWAARFGRAVLTHDVATMPRDADDRVREGKPMHGVFEVGRPLPMGVVIEEIVLLAEFSLDGEWQGQVRYLPLQ